MRDININISDERRLEMAIDREMARREREAEARTEEGAYRAKMLRDQMIESIPITTKPSRKGGIDRFSRAQFEAALIDMYRAITGDAEADFHPMGLDMGEYSYRLMLAPSVSVVIRSSVDSAGYAAECGADSIRLIVESSDGSAWLAVGKGPDAYTTRVNGWEARLREKLAGIYERYHRVKRLAPGERLLVVKKAGLNKGRLFATDGGDKFRWID
jgi:hypothetical protein